MYKENKILCIIPARAGSKGIINKNIYMINNKPLLYYTIRPASLSKYIDYVMVSTDSESIAKIARECGAQVPFLRPKEYATDTSKTIDAVVHTIDELKKNNALFDYVIILQPTQPMRTTKHIDDSIEFTIDNDYRSMASINMVREHPQLMKYLSAKNEITSFLVSNSTVRRQDFSKLYKINGAIYINKLDETFTANTSFNDNEFGLDLKDYLDLDIDTIDEMEYFQYLVMKSNLRNL